MASRGQEQLIETISGFTEAPLRFERVRSPALLEHTVCPVLCCHE